MVQSPASITGLESPFVTLDSVLRQMRDCNAPEDLVRLSIEYLSSAFEAPLVWIAFYDAESHQLVGQGGATIAPNCSLLQETLVLEPGQILEQVVIEQRTIAVPDLPQESRMGLWRQESKSLGIVGCLLVPIRFEKDCLGVLMMGSQLWGGTASEEEMAILGILTGQMASCLQVMEEKLRRHQKKQADIPLVALGTAMRNFDTFADRVKAAIAQIKAFVEVKQVRVFWLDRERNEFAVRWSSCQPPSKPGKSSTVANGPMFTARGLEPTFSALVEGQVAIVGEAGLSGRLPINARTLKELGCRSVMLVPVLFEGELLGFFSVESEHLRSWSEAEQALVVGSVQFVALASPLEHLETRLDRIESDNLLNTQVAQTIYAQTDWNAALQTIAKQLCSRLDASACLMLQTATHADGYRVRVAYSTERNLPVPPLFRRLSGRDLEDLLCEDMAVAAESYPEDLRLTVWQEEFSRAGVRSILAARTTAAKISHKQDLQAIDPEGIVLILHPQPRGWHREDRQLLLLVAQQIGVVFRQMKLGEVSTGQAQLLEQLRASIEDFSQAQTPEELYDLATTHLKNMFAVPFAAGISWPANSPSATLQSMQVTEDEYRLPTANPPIAGERDALIQWCLQSSEPLMLEAKDLHDSSRLWLQSTKLGQVMAIAIDNRQSIHIPSFLLIVGDNEFRQWQDWEQEALVSLRSDLASNLNRLFTQQVLLHRFEELTELNWYKHRQLATTNQNIGYQLKRLAKGIPDHKDLDEKKLEELLRGLAAVPNDLKGVGREYWQPLGERSAVLSATLIRRVLRRVEPLVQQRKLWPRVHGEATLSISTHPARLEMVLVELIATIAKRSDEGGNLEIWVQGEEKLFAISIVDSAKPLPQDLLGLLEELRQQGSEFAWLSPLYNIPLLQQSPCRELYLCQAAVAKLGGELEIYLAEDGRTVTHLRLPVVKSQSSKAS